jgi:hypothetical protein
MAMMVAQVVENIMAKIEETIVEHLSGGQSAPPGRLVDLIRSLHEDRMLRTGQFHGCLRSAE